MNIFRFLNSFEFIFYNFFILGHGLRPLDIEFMRQLHDKVNIIPVIAKGIHLVN